MRPATSWPWSNVKDELANWKESDLISGSLWTLGARDTSGAHKGNNYHGLFVPQVPNQLIRKFTEPGDVVLDMFAGSGTSGIEARRLGRHWIGFELNPDRAKQTQELLDNEPNPHNVLTNVTVVNSTSRLETSAAFQVDALHTGKIRADLTIVHPPYHDIIQFSDDPNDLSNCKTVEEFRSSLKLVMSNARYLTRDKGAVTLVIGDAYQGGEYLPLSAWAIVDNESIGLILKAICVKDIQGNEQGKGKNTNLWRYRALKNGLYTFQHEYVIVFRREM